MLAREGGVREEQLRDLHRWRQSEHFDDAEREALELAEGMTRTPVAVSDELVSALRERLGERALVELVSIIALENYRARFNWAFDIGAEGFSEGKFCPVPVADEETTRPQPEEPRRREARARDPRSPKGDRRSPATRTRKATAAR